MSDPNLEAALEFADNPEPRCPCVLLLDTSGSMQGPPIDALNEGLRAFKNDLARDTMASKRVEVAVVSFNSEVTVVQDFVTVDSFEPPLLASTGVTKMGSAVLKALDLVTERKALYNANGIQYYRPWVFLITDGAPQGEDDSIFETAVRRVQEDENAKHVAFFAVGVEDANMDVLRRLCVRDPVKLNGLNFTELFVWLSKSTGTVAHAKNVDDMVALPPAGWGAVG